MKILLRAQQASASLSPRAAARPPRPTSVPIKHRNRKKPNFIIIMISAGGRGQTSQAQAGTRVS